MYCSAACIHTNSVLHEEIECRVKKSEESNLYLYLPSVLTGNMHKPPHVLDRNNSSRFLPSTRQMTPRPSGANKSRITLIAAQPQLSLFFRHRHRHRHRRRKHSCFFHLLFLLLSVEDARKKGQSRTYRCTHLSLSVYYREDNKLTVLAG